MIFQAKKCGLYGQGVSEGVTKCSGKHLAAYTPEHCWCLLAVPACNSTHTRGLHNEVAASLAEFQVYLGLACLSLGSAERNWQCPAPVATKLTSVVAPVCCSLVLQTMPRASSQERPRRQKISVGKAFQLLVCVLLAALAGSGGW